jgi:hypothetical protein
MKKCNKCGKKYEIGSGQIHQFQKGFGYGSEFDLELWEFVLCDNCMENIINQFVIPIKKIEFSPLDNIEDIGKEIIEDWWNPVD